MVRAGQDKLQKWLVKRLAHKFIPNFQRAEKISIYITRKNPIRNDFNAIWSSLRIGSEVPTTRERAIQIISKAAISRTIIIAIYGVRNLDNNMLFQLRSFWAELIRSLPSQTKRHTLSRIILFLTDDVSDDFLCQQCNFQCRTFNHEISSVVPIALSALERILPKDLEIWLKFNCHQLSSEDHIDKLIRDDRFYRSDPAEMINNICEEFGLERGIEDITHFWELTA